jgi:hypothetical protein
LKNIGRASAQNVNWEIDYASEHNLVRTDHPRTIDVIHPGEHFDLGLILTFAVPSHTTFVSWTDQNGSRQTPGRSKDESGPIDSCVDAIGGGD